jgi:GNAT superfamily N-acetyltransferase
MSLVEHSVAPLEWRRDGFLISNDRGWIDVPAVHEFLSTRSYWARGIPIETVRRAIENSLCFGVYAETVEAPMVRRPAGFARVTTDFATFAWIGDVFIIEEFRGRGLSKWLMETIVAHPLLQGLRRLLLATHDAHELYRQFGFKPLSRPERFLELRFPDVYAAPRPDGRVPPPRADS